MKSFLTTFRTIIWPAFKQAAVETPYDYFAPLVGAYRGLVDGLLHPEKYRPKGLNKTK